jgi:glutamate decarboxylase
MGTACTGSSEAIMLGGLALKRRWQAKMKAAGKDIHNPGPNIVMGAEAQVALEKFARYFEVDCRLVPVTKEVSPLFSRLMRFCANGNRATTSWMLRML